MSSIGLQATSIPKEHTVASSGRGVCLIVLLLFVIAAGFAAQRKDITQGFDEVAHASYVAHLQSSGEFWPQLEAMRMLDPQTFRLTGEANYLNHPPPFYKLLALTGPALEGHPAALLVHRLLNVLLATAGLAALLAIGVLARLPRLELYAYVLPLVCVPVLAPLAGAINNDNLAFAGGALATLAAWQLVATGRIAWLMLALAGIIAAAGAKLTGLMLASGPVAVACIYLIWRGRLSWFWMAAVAIGLAIAVTPYAIYFADYGSPVPNTPAQVVMLEEGARTAGWADLPRKSLPGYVWHFVSTFVTDWMPTLAPRSPLNHAMLAIPAVTLVCALVGFFVSVRRVWRRQETALDVIVIGGAMTIMATFTIHLTYSYGRHVATGWLMEAYPRYYLPLAAIIPLATISLLAAIERPRLRVALTSFLIAGPVLFRLLGAPLE